MHFGRNSPVILRENMVNPEQIPTKIREISTVLDSEFIH